MVESLDSYKLMQLYTELGAITGADSATSFKNFTAIAVSAVPSAEFASITRVRDDHFQTIAPTHPDARSADRLQYDCQSGPCIDAAIEEAVFVVDDLATDRRWPKFGPLAAALLGVSSMFSVRLTIDDDMQASLNVYSKKTRAFDPASRAMGILVAAHGSGVLGAVLARERVMHAEWALTNSRRIGMAIGILMSNRRITSDDAFALLRVASQNSNRRVVLVAEDVIESGLI